MNNMKLELNKKEAKAVLELLSLGPHIMEEGGCSKAKRKDYDSAILKVFGEYLQAQGGTATVTDVTIRFSVEETLMDIEDCLERYVKNNLPDNIAAALADYQYPVKDCISEEEEYSKNQIAEDMYLQVLKEKGMSAVHIDIPDFEEKVNQEFQANNENIEKVAILKSEAKIKFFEAIAARMNELFIEKQLTAEELSERSGVSFSILSKILSGNGENFEWKMLNKFCKTLNIGIGSFFESKVFKDLYETEFFKKK